MASNRTSGPRKYTAGLEPIIPGGSDVYAAKEIARVGNSVNSIQPFTPQVAVTAPAMPTDGMVRLARSPWRPLPNQTQDQWVYYNGPTSSWVAFP